MQRIRRLAASPQPRDYWLSIAGQARASQQKRAAHVRVIVVRSTSSRHSRHVRFAPKADDVKRACLPKIAFACRRMWWVAPRKIGLVSGSRSMAQRLIPVLTTGIFDRHNPPDVEREL